MSETVPTKQWYCIHTDNVKEDMTFLRKHSALEPDAQFENSRYNRPIFVLTSLAWDALRDIMKGRNVVVGVADDKNGGTQCSLQNICK